MEKYQELEMTIISFDKDDIIITSPGGGNETFGLDDDTDH